MRTIDRFLVATALSISAASAANAQAGSGQPAPGSGNSTQITNGNRENNAGYNHVVGSGVKSATVDDAPRAKPSAPGPATAADLKAGSALRDKDGVKIGTIDSVDADGAIVNTGQTKIKVPLVAFGKDNQGLLLGITAARFNELVAKAHSGN
jgi:hypothetical protein